MIPQVAALAFGNQVSSQGGSLARDMAVKQTYTQTKSTGTITSNTFSSVQPSGDGTTFIAILTYQGRGSTNGVLNISGVADSWQQVKKFTYQDNLDGSNNLNTTVEVWTGYQATRNAVAGTITVNHSDGSGISAAISDVATGRLLAFTGLSNSPVDANTNAYPNDTRRHNSGQDTAVPVTVASHSSNASIGLDFAVMTHQDQLSGYVSPAWTAPPGWAWLDNLQCQNSFSQDAGFAYRPINGPVTGVTEGSFGTVKWWGCQVGIINGNADATFKPLVAANSSFTYSAANNAREGHLWDGDDTTLSADPAGLNASTFATYDMGGLFTASQVRMLTGSVGGFTNAATFKILRGDVSPTGAFTDTGTTIAVPSGTNQVATQNVSDGTHRFWKILYNSGTTGGNAWLGDLSYSGTMTDVVLWPTAWDTSFQNTSSGNAETNLWNRDFSTTSADSLGLNSSSHIAFDFGSAKTITAVSATTGATGGFANAGTFKIQYSDTSLTAGWTDTGSNIVIPAGTNVGALVTGLASGAHRFWRIVYLSGTTGGNAWLADFSFYGH